ncbi:ABC transporter ATP-binding protein [Sporosarcina pasteurii]|uniref:Arginine transport ATP-binding protein ArtM n=1 Tax=Sporosarcina pasteurii TaxID=1474 RepID=A0A380BBF4_SPOPA|nr:ABC transporter ATP-binding protein [Sporosarcina pasteurii]MDS9472926.1 ABC transporter ATP-binding protein [Sporosarcina pasteurii]QBQ06469.1 ABC transporter ATP-binding protein [Sporosarcina pasteurii]SUI98407.1 Arginine transport ATP-binding protein ArtM [Sporosarcina pasteurii]
MIKIENLTHSYAKHQVLDDVNLHILKNERCALVGRNGAGKSTMIHTMLGLIPLQIGSITLGGFSNKKQDWKRVVSYLPEKFNLYPHLTGEENIRFFASLASKRIDDESIDEKLKLVSLYEARNDQITTYSKGMLQRLGLAVMLYYDSDIIILDEPTSGLDPVGRKEILAIIKSLTNKTIMMASHHLNEIEEVCTHVAYLEKGKITKYSIEAFLSVDLKERQQA